jgi:hypothetical protein
VDFEERWKTGFTLLLGLLAVSGGLWVRSLELRERAETHDIQGVVVGTEEIRRRDHQRNEDRITYAPVIEFQVRNKPVRFQGVEASYRASTGNKVLVRFDPSAAAESPRVVDPLEGLTPWALCGLGGMAIVSAASAIVRLSR